MTATLMIRAHDIMSREVVAISEDVSVDNAARMMFEHQVSGLPVVNEENYLLGVVTEFDVIARQGETVADIMTSNVVTVGEDTDPETIANLLIERRIRRLPVVTDGKVVGMISRSDLVKLFALTRWSCEDCGYYTRGFERLTICPKCGNTHIVLEREPPGS